MFKRLSIAVGEEADDNNINVNLRFHENLQDLSLVQCHKHWNLTP